MVTGKIMDEVIDRVNSLVGENKCFIRKKRKSILLLLFYQLYMYAELVA